MKLSKAGILVCRGSAEIKSRLAAELKIAPTTVYRLISENKENGPLTTQTALEAIRQESGLGDDQILERITEQN